MNYFNPTEVREGASVPHQLTPIPIRESTQQYTPEQLLSLRRELGNDVYYSAVRQMALDNALDILEHWLPDGELRGREWVALNPMRNDGELGSFSINTESGVWADFAEVETGGDLIALVKYLEDLEYYSEAAERILLFLAERPEPVTVQPQIRAAQPPVPEYTPIMPIPEVTPAMPASYGQGLGRPTTRWVYRNAQGQPLFYVLRFDLTDGSKQFRSLTLCQDAAGNDSWRFKAPSENRPLYGLERLAMNPEATVIFAEGEKSADAAQLLFPNCVGMTTMNGAQSPAKSDFSPLSGRRVVIAPDYDDAGKKYTESVIRLVIAAGGTVERILDNEALAQAGEKLPKGFDLADAAELGWTADRLQSLGEALWMEVLYPSAHSVSVQAVPALPASRVSGRGQESFIEGVREIVSSLFNDQIIYVSGRPYLYRKGYWPAVDEVVFVQKPLAQSLAGFGKKDTPTSVNAHMQMIRTLYAEDETRWATNSLLCLANGALDPATGTLYPHSPEHHLVNKVDITYDPDAACPLWLQTLDEIFAPDPDKEDKIRLLQEYIGYCLVPDTRMCQFLWMVGGGGNGKSLILSILTELIGRENVGNSQIERLDRAFVRAELQGKLVNISSEMSAQATVSDGYLKQIVSGDLIEAERKHEKPFSFKPYARLIAATNNLPRLLDHSDGFFRRAIILRFNRQFTEQDRDINRENRLRAELPGILNWALAGLRALNARGRFVIPPSSEHEILRYRTDSDPIRQYAEEKLVQDRDSRVQSRELYEDYVQWSRGNGYQPLATNSFASRLESLGFQRGRNAQGRYWQAQFVWPMAERTESSISSLAAQYMV